MSQGPATSFLHDDYREIPVPAGCLAEVVTYLEMRSPPEWLDQPISDAPWRLERRPAPDVDWYLRLFREVGAEWLWYSRLVMSRAEVAHALAKPGVEVYALMRGEREVGIGELNFSEPGEVEICFFGVVASEVGAGAGRWLMSALLRRAFAEKPARVWLHTCTFDHPNALPFYQRQGFRAYKRTVGIYSDPRLGVLSGEPATMRAPIIPPKPVSDAGEGTV